MPYSSEFQTLAEIAIAMAGFAGIISALQSRSSANWRGRYARLRELLLSSLGVVFFAFLPTLFQGAVDDPIWALRGPQLVFAIFHLSLLVVFLRTAGIQELNAYEWVLMPLVLIVIGIQFSTGFGFFSEYLPEAYFLGLIWLLFVAANNFRVLLLSDVNDA